MTRKSGDLPSEPKLNLGRGVRAGPDRKTLLSLFDALAPRAEGATMIWKTDTHEFSATVCQRTGKPCPALAHMARALTQAISTAQPVSTQEFQVEGSSELAHCAEGCTARFRAYPDQVRVFCGTDPDVTTDMLDEFADMMFGDSFATLPAGLLTNPPCAMLEASALAHHPKADIQLHATA